MAIGGGRASGGTRRTLLLSAATTLGTVAALLHSALGAATNADIGGQRAPSFESDLDGRSPLAAQPSSTCTGCHRLQQSFSHPVDFAPSSTIPSSLPLHGGRMTCTTCHDPVTARGHAEQPARGLSFLRGGDTVSTICSACHDAMSGRAGVHGKGIPWAHLESAKKDRRADHGADPESQSCMSCHDGVNASDAGAHSVRGMGSRGLPGELGDHPIGVVFGAPALRGQPEIRLVSPARLDRRIRLFDRAVGCGSCHNPYARSDALLVMSNHRSQLCLACHVE
ncbi:MAG: cytochrome c3 family protein [Phycisphaerales bacterium]